MAIVFGVVFFANNAEYGWNVLPLIASLAFLLLPSYFWARRIRALHRKKSCFQNDVANIRNRISSIEMRREKLLQLSKDIASSHVRAEMAATDNLIQSTLPILGRIQARYEVELWRIRLLRWKNSVEPLLFGAERGTAGSRASIIGKVSEAITRGKTMLDEVSTADNGGGLQDIRRQLDEAIAANGTFLQLLYNMEARSTIKGLSPLEEGRPIVQDGAFATVFDSHLQAAALKRSLEDLEAEFDRMSAEDLLKA
jgi:hypothetical protein